MIAKTVFFENNFGDAQWVKHVTNAQLFSFP
jgi:hypothetical protein